MARKANIIQILQFDERVITCLRVKPSAVGVTVDSIEQSRGEWRADDGSLARALSDFAKRHRLSDAPVYTVLPRHDLTARVLVLPSHDAAEISRMIQFSAEELVPYPVEDMVIDQCVLATLPDGHSRVMAVLAHKDTIDSHLKALREAGLEPADIFLSTACIATAAAAARVTATERFALVNVGAAGWEALVMNGRKLEYTRGIASPQDWTRTRESLQEGASELGAELRASLSAFRRESEEGHEAESVYLSSECASVDALCESLSPELGVTCSPATFALALAPQDKDKLSTLPLALLGGALAAQGRSTLAISLLPKTVRDSRGRASAKRMAIMGGAVAAACAIGLAGLYGEAVYQRKSYLAELAKQTAVIQDVAQGVSLKQKQLRLVQGHLDRSGSVLELLAKLADLAPPSGLNVTRVFFKRNDSITIEGRSETKESVNQLADALRGSGVPNLEQTISGTLKAIDERGKGVWQYELVSRFPARDTTEGEPSEGAASE